MLETALTIPLDPLLKNLDLLPKRIGVYIFLNDEKPIYIGKSINIRNRILSHFNSTKTQIKEAKIIQQADTISCIYCAGEQSALLLEAELVKKYLPIYNRKLRRQKKLLTGVICKGKPYWSLELIPYHHSHAKMKQYGFFKNQAQFNQYVEKLCDKYQLCRKICGIEKARYGCFQQQIKKCLGGCVGLEDPTSHNRRLQKALNRSEIQKWPFKGPITITEVDAKYQFTQSHLVNNWIYYGRWDQDNTGALQNDIDFDVDQYHIIRKVIHQNKLPIKTL